MSINRTVIHEYEITVTTGKRKGHYFTVRAQSKKLAGKAARATMIADGITGSIQIRKTS